MKARSKTSIFIETTGNDSTARRGAIDFPCQTIAKAISLAIAGDTIFIGSGQFDIGTQPIDIPNKVNLIGKGSDSSIVVSAVDLDEVGCSFCPGDDSIVRGLTIRVGDTHSGFGACVGTYGQKGFVNALVDQCVLIGTSDVIYYHQSNVFKSITIQRSTLQGSWDGISLFDGNHKTVLSDSALTLVGPPKQGDQSAACHAIILSGVGGIIDIKRSTVKVSGPNSGNRGVWNTQFGPNSTINICGSTFDVSGTDSKVYDVYSSSVLNLSDSCV